jgi:RHS repeat-associated protein
MWISGLIAFQHFGGSSASPPAWTAAGEPLKPPRALRAAEALLSVLSGSTVAVSDAAGQAVGRVQYDPYGAVLTSTLPVTLTERLFTGARFDGTIGLYDYRARFYDPALGRFISADPVVPGAGNPQALNRYAYVYNNPLRYTDPTGHYILLEGEPGTPEEFAVRQAQNTVVVLHGGNLFPTAEHVAVANYVLTGDLRYLNQIPEQTGPWGPGILVDVFTALGYEYRSWQGQVWGQIGPVVAGAGVIFTPGQERDYPSGNVPAGERLGYTETPWDAAARGPNAISPYYPPNRGFDGQPVKTTLQPGTVVDRYGGTGGSFASPQGTPPWARSLL